MLVLPTIGHFLFLHQVSLMAVFIAGAGLYFVFRGLQLLSRRLRFANIPSSAIREASAGPIGIAGVANGPHTLSAPISGKPCYLYQATVWQPSGQGRRGEWKQIAEETLHLPFFVEDLTGQLLVEPFEAELDLRRDCCQEFGALFSSASQQAIPPRVSVFLARHGIPSGRPTRIEERLLEPGAPVFIAGMLAGNPGIRLSATASESSDGRVANVAPNLDSRAAAASSPARKGSTEVIHLSGGSTPSSTASMTQQEKIAAALTRAGIKKPEAWAAAGVALPDHSLRQSSLGDDSSRGESSSAGPDRAPFAAADARAAAPRTATIVRPDWGSNPNSDQGQTKSAPAGPAPSLALLKGEANSTFVISHRSRQELVGAPAWEPVAMLIGGLALSALGAYTLVLGRIR